MALFSFGKKKNTTGAEAPLTAKERAFAAQQARKRQALETGFVKHTDVEKQYRRQRFFVMYERQIRAAFILGGAAFVLLITALVVLVILRNAPGRDDDRDGVPNTEDVCPGFDDAKDADDDGVPDGCEERPGSTELTPTEVTIVTSGQDRYDVALKLTNPNADWGVSPLEYSVRLIAEDESVITTSTRNRTFLLPGQTKYLTAFDLLAVLKPVRAELVVSVADWLKVQNYTVPRLETATVVVETPGQPGAQVRLKGKTTNFTTFTFDNIQITVLVRRADGTLVALNHSEIDTLQPGEGRDFIATFPEAIPEVANATFIYETDVDLFQNESFVQTTVVQGQRFQQFTPQPAQP